MGASEGFHESYGLFLHVGDIMLIRAYRVLIPVAEKARRRWLAGDLSRDISKKPHHEGAVYRSIDCR